MAMIAGTGFPGLGTPPPPAAPAAPVPDVPNVRPGSTWDAKLLRGRIQTLLAEMDRAGDHLGALLETARDKHIYRMLESPTGGYFPDWTAFVTAPQPWGLGMDAALLEALVKEGRDPHRRARLVLEGPPLLETRSAPRKGRAPAPRVRGTEYSLQRLKRDRPELLERVAAGELTIQAAAEQAGHRPALTGVLVEPQSLARLIVSRLDAAQQRELLDLVAHPEKITDPGHGTNAYWDAYRERTTPPDELARQRARAAAAKAAHRKAYEAAYNARRGEQKAAARQTEALAFALPSLASVAP